MFRVLLPVAALALALCTTAALAAGSTADKPKPQPAKAAPKAAKPVKAAKKAVPPPVPEVPDEPLADAQLEIASRVHTGHAACELNQAVQVHPVEGKPGFFKVAHGKAVHTMVPQETTTGAVRLEDKRSGHVWIQIPAKSMLMDARAGRRVVDACQHEPQRTAAAAPPAGEGIGIVAAPPR